MPDRWNPENRHDSRDVWGSPTEFRKTVPSRPARPCLRGRDTGNLTVFA